MTRRPSGAEVPRPEVLAFLKDIKETPQDDTPRLVLADWLEEHGDPRGSFVRLQCLRARRGDGAAEPEGREAELLQEHRAAWLGVLGERGIQTEFRRGLVSVRGSVRKLLSKRLAGLPPLEALAWADSLCLYDVKTADVAKLKASPHWGCLTCLDIGGFVYYGDNLAGQFTAGFGVAGGVVLASLPVLASLSELHLARNDIGAEGMAALAARTDLGRLRTLDLSSNNLRDEGAAALASCRSLTGLTELHLVQNRIGPEGFAALARWPGLANLVQFSVWANYPGPEGVAALAASPYLGRLTELRLGVDPLRPHRIGPEGAAALSKSTGLRSLKRLSLCNSAIGPEGAVALAGSDTLTELLDLDLSANAIGDAGAVALASSPILRNLVRLDLRHNGIGEEGARALAASPYLASLEYLNCRANEVGDEGLAALRERFGDILDI
jgi:uncharacterized protein (TIGR02996 family)